MDLVIMAAGMGSRFCGLKQVEPVGPSGEFIIDYSIYDAIKAGIERVVFIIKKENYDLFRNTVGKRIEGKIDVEYVFQEKDSFINDKSLSEVREKPWGTAHAILCCKDIVKNNFIVINADDFYGYEPFKLIKEYMDKVDLTSTNFSMAGYIIKNTLSENGTVKRGLCKSRDGYLSKLVESVVGYENNKLIAKRLIDDVKVEVLEDDLVSMNFFGFTPKIFEELEKEIGSFLEVNKDNINNCEYLLPEVVENMIKDNKCNVKVIKTKSKWYGVTYKEDKEFLEKSINKLIDNGEYPKSLW